MAEKLLTPEEVAERLAVTSNTVRGWLRSGTLKGIKLGKRVWRISESTVNAQICKEKSAVYESEGSNQPILRQKLLEDLAELSHDNVDKVYKLILELKKSEELGSEVYRKNSYLKAREALNQYKGSLSNIIDHEREDRL